MLDKALALGCEISWGTGQLNGSYSIKESTISHRSLFSVYSNGRLSFNSGWINGDETSERGREAIKNLITTNVGLSVPENYVKTSPVYEYSEWYSKVQLLEQSLDQIVMQFRQAS